MTDMPGPRDPYGRPQDHVPGRPDPDFDAGLGGYEEPRRGGFSTFPFPGYTTRTKNGTSITVGGCCLPLPLGCLTTLLSVGGYGLYRVARARH